MLKLIPLLSLFLGIPNLAKSQVTPNILHRVHLNIQSYGWKEFLDNAKSYRPEIIVNKMEDLNLNCGLNYEQIPVDMEYPKSGFQLFGFQKKGLNCEGFTKKISFSDGLDFNIFLIAIDTASNKLQKPIKYLSGQMFLDNISLDFELDVDLPESYLDYLRMKMFDLQLEKIKFINEKKGILYFQAYSSFTKVQLNISVNTDTWDNQIEFETME